MILDITAIRDYQNTDNLQKLAMNINMENVILLLDNSPESDSKTYLSKLISLGIYNFTRNIEGINYLLVHPHNYKDVVNIHNLSELEANTDAGTSGTLNLGGLGIIHKNMDDESQVREIRRVKKSESGIIIDPVCVL
jgi:hypothetical protein